MLLLFNCSVMSNSLLPHGLQHARLPCPLPSLGASQTHVHWVSMPSNHLILCSPHLLLPSIFPSIKVFSNELALCIRWPKYWNFSFSNRSSNEYSRLIYFRIDCFDLFAVQGTLKSSPTSQFKSISSLALCLLYHPTLTSIHDHWKNHSFYHMDLCWQSNVSVF